MATGVATGVAAGVATGASTVDTIGAAAASIDGIIVADAMIGSVDVGGEIYWMGSAAT